MSEWHKSSYSDTGGHCAEVRETTEFANFRDSKYPDEAVLTFDSAEWRAFLEGVRSGEV
ncbi:DUF397 domain-containing protein [Salinactinospora qingdaonensis]|uniref:DUF397 domain-containing protein n=1 Tax=Salinactinospora qingdaonensis TaxID=702744 RepID=A0ABP7FMB6_9ACTN